MDRHFEDPHSAAARLAALHVSSGADASRSSVMDRGATLLSPGSSSLLSSGSNGGVGVRGTALTSPSPVLRNHNTQDAVSEYYRSLAADALLRRIDRHQAALAAAAAGGGSFPSAHPVRGTGLGSIDGLLGIMRGGGMMDEVPFVSSSYLASLLRNCPSASSQLSTPSTLGGGLRQSLPLLTSPSLMGMSTDEIVARRQYLEAQEAAAAAAVAAAVNNQEILHQIATGGSGGGVVAAGTGRIKRKATTAGKGTRTKKPKDMPKRPLSAYNIFFREERAKILDAIPAPMGYPGPEEQPDEQAPPSKRGRDYYAEDRRRRGTSFSGGDGDDAKTSSPPSPPRQRAPHGKIGFETLAKIVGKRWKSLRPDRLAHYKTLAEEDMQRYQREMDEYHQVQAEKQRAEEEAESKHRVHEDEKQGEEGEYDHDGDEKEHVRQDELHSESSSTPRAQRIREQQQGASSVKERKRKMDAVGTGLGSTSIRSTRRSPTQDEMQQQDRQQQWVHSSDSLSASDYSRSYLKRLRLNSPSGFLATAAVAADSSASPSAKEGVTAQSKWQKEKCTSHQHHDRHQG